MFTYWLDFPPSHLLLRAQIGYKGRKRKPTDEELKLVGVAHIGGKYVPSPAAPIANLPGYVQTFIRNMQVEAAAKAAKREKRKKKKKKWVRRQ